MPWYDLGMAIVFLLGAVFQYRNYRRTSLRWSLLAACCFLLGVVIFCGQSYWRRPDHLRRMRLEWMS